MGTGRQILEGSTVKSTGKIAQIPVGQTLGRVVNPLAFLLMVKAKSSLQILIIEAMAPGY
jgi:F-type H+-transporting ATPase subunit alpha